MLTVPNLLFWNTKSRAHVIARTAKAQRTLRGRTKETEKRFIKSQYLKAIKKIAK
jgi:hypothetical protein